MLSPGCSATLASSYGSVWLMFTWPAVHIKQRQSNRAQQISLCCAIEEAPVRGHSMWTRRRYIEAGQAAIAPRLGAMAEGTVRGVLFR